jgi:dipeptidyl aminopeptidase/acylaminoacyl peptidase
VLAWLAPLVVSALAEPTHDVVPEDQFALDELRGLSANLNGTRLAFVRARWDDALDLQRTDLWTVETGARTAQRLTFTQPDAHAPRFGPLGTHVYYLAADDHDRTQVWRVPSAGGTPLALTSAPDGVTAFRLDANGGVWFSTCHEDPVSDPWTDLRDAHPLSYVDRAVTTCTIHTLDLGTWRVADVWSPGAHVAEFDVAPDGTRVAAVVEPDAELIVHEGRSRVVIRDLATAADVPVPDAAWRDGAPSRYGWVEGLSWASDGRALAFRVDYDGHPAETWVAELAGAEARAWKVPRPEGAHVLDGALLWVPGERELCQRVGDHARVRLMCVAKLRGGSAGKPETFPRGDVVVNDFVLSGDGRDVFATIGTPTSFPDVYRLPARGNLLPVRLHTANPHTESWRLPTLSVVSWKAPDGTSVEGILETPAGWSAAQGPLPLVVVLHGGPTAMDTLQRSFSYGGRTAFAARGWAVLAPNYRGSLGYGDAFTTALVGRENDVEVKDVLAGIDHLVATGVADAERLAVMGWSNGGYLVNALVAATDRFDAAISGAGVVDQAMQWALEDTPGHVINFMQGQPWERPEAYLAASPLYGLAGARTPTLVHVGEHDARVPAAHAHGLFRALGAYLDVPVELVVYPDAGHGLRKLSHRKAKVAWDHAWLERWVLGARGARATPAPPPTP